MGGWCGFSEGWCGFSEGWCRGRAAGPAMRSIADGGRSPPSRPEGGGLRPYFAVLQILMWGQSSSTGTVLPSVRMTLTRLGRQMACSPSLASQPFLMQTWSGQSLVIKAMR